MLIYSIRWRPPIWGGRLFQPLPRLILAFLFHIFCKMYFSYIKPNQRKKIGFKMLFHPPEISYSPYATIEVLMPRLRCSYQDWGAHAKITVLMPRLRCSCWDLAPQSWPEHRNLGMSTSNLAWAPQSKHSNYLPKSNSLFQGDEMKFWTQAFFLQLGDVHKKYIWEQIGRQYFLEVATTN